MGRPGLPLPFSSSCSRPLRGKLSLLVSFLTTETADPASPPSQVLEEPDCVLAILLVERTLEARFGDTYMRLALPPFLEATWLGDDGEPGGEAMVGDSSDSVDAALRRMKGSLGRCLRIFTPIDSQGLMRSEDGGGSGGYGS
ncbi:hypothetical protein Vretifemale_1886 [Volvox reticuliferus]|nr:hypothetical protein Vretifemale_1886 [Volvox reticuliferus]